MIIECNFQRSVKTDVFSNNLGVLATVNSAFTPIISKVIRHTDLRTSPDVLRRSICVTVNNFFSC